MQSLLNRKGHYYFRTRLPKGLGTNRKELWISLRTGDKKQASIRAAKLLERLGMATSFDLSLFKILPDGTKQETVFDANNPKEEAFFKELWVKGEAAKAPSLNFQTVSHAYLACLLKDDKKAAHNSCAHTFELFKNFFGDIHFSELTQGTLGSWKRHAETLKARNKSVPISSKTVAGHIKNIVSLSTWARAHYDHVPLISSSGLVAKRSIRASEERDAFTDEDIAKLLQACEQVAHKWLLLIGAYTGARLNEICQLNLHTDVVTEEGVTFINITDGDDQQRVKTTTARRQIPLHPELTRCGLLAYFKDQTDAGYTRPFESLWRMNQDSWAKYPSKWFSAHKTKVLGRNKKLVFHSFRHTVANKLKKAGVEEAKVAAILGHSTGSMTFDRYGKPYTAVELQSVISELSYAIKKPL